MSKIRNRAVSWIVFVVFSFVIFSSSLFIVAHADHDCTGEDCSVCMELAECYNTLHTLGTAVTGAARLLLSLFCVSEFVKIVIKTRFEHTTLISLKVELLN